MTKYPIQSDIDLPKTVRRGKGFEDAYPFRMMEPGDSIFIPDADAKISGIISNVSRMNKRNILEAVFKARMRTENGVAGTRVWRVS